MEPEKIGQVIKEIRTKHHLTQKDFAEKYGVTYQAVSKWETGKNMPDISLVKQISKDFQINIEDILEGKITTTSNQKNQSKSNFKLYLLCSSIMLVIAIISITFLFNQDKNIQLKALSTPNDRFNISGSIAYNDSLSSIYISQIKYRDSEDRKIYQEVECILYETDGETNIQISKCDYDGTAPILLEDFFQNLTLQVDNYKRTCKEYSKNSLFLQINATDEEGEITSYKVPLSINDNCSK